MKKKITTLIILAAIACCVMFADVFLVFKYYKKLTVVEQVFTSREYELGNVNIDTELDKYIATSGLMYKKATLDISDVKTDTVGDYEIVCTVGDTRYFYDIHIVDTTAPNLSFAGLNKKFGNLNSYKITDITSEAVVEDFSEVKDIELIGCSDSEGNDIELTGDEFCFEEPGVYIFKFSVSDIYDNAATTELELNVLEAPHFVLLEDREYKVGAPFEMSDLVYAYDRNGKDITDKIVISDDGYDINEEGEYKVTYSVTDGDGIKRTETVNISVGDFDKNSYGFEYAPENIQVLIDHDYFTYEVLADGGDADEIIEMTKYACFGAKDKTGWGYEAFIYRITAGYVYMMTADNVDAFEREEVYFIDYDDLLTKVSRIDCEGFRSDKNNVKILQIPITCFDISELLTYKEVTVDWDIYDSMEKGDAIITNSQAYGGSFKGIEDCESEEFIDEFLTDELMGKTLYRDYSYLTTTRSVTRIGQRGSAAFNDRGYFIGICSVSAWDSYGPSADCYVPLSFIKELVDGVEIE